MKEKERDRGTAKQPESSELGATQSLQLSVIILSGSGFNSPVFWPRVTEWMKNQDLFVCCRRLTSAVRRYVGLTGRDRQRYPIKMKTKREQGL